jgi:hypothetical protein
MTISKISPIVKHYQVIRSKVSNLVKQVDILKKKIFQEKALVQKEQDEKDIAQLKKVIDG